MKYCHVSIIAKDWRKLSKFYQDVFDCVPLDPERHSTGQGVAHLINAETGEMHGEHVMVPGYGDQGPTLEILTIDPHGAGTAENVYDYGFTHICFEMDDIRPTLQKILDYGGNILSSYPDPFEVRCLYAKDPEGNIVEIRRPNPVPDTIRPIKKD